jgi:hypothetical protein
MVKKNVTMNINVTVPMSYTKAFQITKEVDIDEEWQKEEKWSDEEYVEENFEQEFFKDAEQQMEKELDKIDMGDLDYEDYESEFDY